MMKMWSLLKSWIVDHELCVCEYGLRLLCFRLDMKTINGEVFGFGGRLTVIYTYCRMAQVIGSEK
jgi:hypothetical protein